MQISPISNNNTNFHARFIRNPKFKELSQNAEIRKGITENTLELGAKLKKIGEGHDLEIFDAFAYKSCNGEMYHNVGIKNHYTNRQTSLVFPHYVQFWDGVLTELLQDKNKKFFEFENDADKFINLIAEEDK